MMAKKKPIPKTDRRTEMEKGLKRVGRVRGVDVSREVKRSQRGKKNR